MARFMLDTDTCSYIMKRSHLLVLKRLQSVPVGRRVHVGSDQGRTALAASRSFRGAPRMRQRAAFPPYVESMEFDETRHSTTPRSVPTSNAEER